MSIGYTFTNHGTIQIECGDEWIEVRIPGGGSGGGGKPKVHSTDGHQASEPEPPTGPGVMSIISNARKRKTTRNLFMLDTSGIEHMNLSQFEHLDPADMRRAMREQIAQMTQNLGNINVLDIDIGELSGSSTTALTNLQKLLNQPDSGIDALRLWNNDKIG